MSVKRFDGITGTVTTVATAIAIAGSGGSSDTGLVVQNIDSSINLNVYGDNAVLAAVLVPWQAISLPWRPSISLAAASGTISYAIANTHD